MLYEKFLFRMLRHGAVCGGCGGAHLDGDADVVEGLSEVLLLHAAGDVAEVQRGAGRVDVLVVLAPRLLEPVQPGVGVVLRQARVRLPVLWQLK